MSIHLLLLHKASSLIGEAQTSLSLTTSSSFSGETPRWASTQGSPGGVHTYQNESDLLLAMWTKLLQRMGQTPHTPEVHPMHPQISLRG